MTLGSIVDQLAQATHDLEAVTAERNILQGQLDDLSESAVQQTPGEREALVDRFGMLGEEILAELRHLRAAMGTESRSSVEITVDSKAVVKPTVKVYSDDPDEAAEKAQEIFDSLIIKYAPSAGEART